MQAALIFPHQLYKDHPALPGSDKIFLIEDELYFSQYAFHSRKIELHQQSMKAYAAEVAAAGRQVEWLKASDNRSRLDNLFLYLRQQSYTRVVYADTTDYLLERRIDRYSRKHGVEAVKRSTPNFICDTGYLGEYFTGKKRYFMATFYEEQRKRTGWLMNGAEPAGGRWSFDTENRRKMPRNTPLPAMPAHTHAYPVTHAEAEWQLDCFLKERFANFGVYQDAIVKKEHFLFHSVISSSLNIGLLDPREVLDKSVSYAKHHQVPLNSVEGFLRQVLGWREYIRAVYLREGVKQRTTNHMGFTRRIPASFYTATTGIDPVDTVIRKVQDTAYAHHIERLMVLGNFMLLCEFHPDDVYRWFMELFIDAYDWVMVPNVYGMSQFADGGLMSTKPYVSSSNYILKMSDFKKGPWCEVWDALFWRFMHVHRPMLRGNPRLSMLLTTYDKMPLAKRRDMMKTAESFLEGLDSGHQTVLL